MAEALTALERAEVPSGKIYTIADIANDPHYAARAMLEQVRLSDGSVLSVPGCQKRKSPNCASAAWWREATRQSQ